MKKSIDYIIVGQGLAGTLVSYFLKKAGKDILVIDNHHQSAASKVAAGTINPVTGRRYVKSWLIEKLIPFAQTTYHDLANDLGVPFYHSMPIIRTLFNHREVQAWEERLLYESYQKYMLEEADLGRYADLTNPAYAYGELTRSAQVEVPKLINWYRESLINRGEILAELFDFEQIEFKEDGVVYKNFEAQKIIFCEGIQAKRNPFFNYLPFLGTKGEALIIKIPNANFKKMLKQRLYIIPLQGDLYWVGATNDVTYEDDLPTEESKLVFVNYLKKILTIPFEVIDHKAAIRPTVKDRRPFLGLHPQYSQLVLFNGLGTKGASLAPYFAHHLTEFLLDGKKLMPEVNIVRYQNFLA